MACWTITHCFVWLAEGSPSTGLIYLTSQGGTTAEYESRGFTCFIRPPNIYIGKTGAANIAIPVPAPAVQGTR